ncbi:hypothetical protein GP486_004871, partial [Trichoglossum hirsutum]
MFFFSGREPADLEAQNEKTALPPPPPPPQSPAGSTDSATVVGSGPNSPQPQQDGGWFRTLWRSATFVEDDGVGAWRRGKRGPLPEQHITR